MSVCASQYNKKYIFYFIPRGDFDKKSIKYMKRN